MSAKPYNPRHSIYAFYATVKDAEPIKAPGLTASLRRNPNQVRKAATVAIAVGALLFGVAESAESAVGEPARLAAGQHAGLSVAAASLSTPVTAGWVEATDVQFRQQGGPVASVLTSAPKHVTKQAPATKKVISGLAANGIPNVALNAYRVAAARVRNAAPGCGIDWALLAGIGRVESDHGRFAGAHLNADGTSTPRILGPALDGVSSDYIPAPANGAALYGDGVYAHALGAMQFIPSTWAVYGSDANGDGKTDVFNINDAALAAARYLCAAGGNLRTAAGQTAAVLAYNHSDAYLAQVLALANAYRTGVPVTGMPVGDTNASLPPLGTVIDVPPVNPGDPTAVLGFTQQNPRKSTTKATKGKAPGTSTHSGSTKKGGSGSTGGGSTGGGSTGGTGTGGGSVVAPLPVLLPDPAPVLPVPNPAPTPAPPTTTAPPAPIPAAPTPAPIPACLPLLHMLKLC